MDLGLHGKVALVTAASRGLGRACAEALAAEGARVAICSRNEERITTTAAEIQQQTGSEVIGFVCDVTKVEDIQRLIREIHERFGHIDILVFNHGNPPPGAFSNIALEQWHEGLNLCIWSAIHLFRSVLPIMKKQRWGRIIVISSIFAKEPDPDYVVSSTLRAGLLGLTKCLARELAPYQITVNTVLAGYFDTPLVRQLAAEEAQRKGKPVQQVLQEWANIVPTATIPPPLELGQLVAWLSSEQARNVTGIAIPIDGGMLKGLC
jgi:3-oxoacyl-[acyl-carrier protein] reductase